jgi:hypothetical protein
MHRFVLAEYNTHRVFSRNSASSRAIPFSKQVARVENDLAYPVSWPQEQKGMQGGAELDAWATEEARDLWREAAGAAVAYATELADLGVHKSVINRLLEPFMWHTVITTATEWDNFWELRCNPAAQPEMRAAAEAMRVAYEESKPRTLAYGEWHLPFVTGADYDWLEIQQLYGDSALEVAKQCSVARCARVSYLTHDTGKVDITKDIALTKRLAESKHACYDEKTEVLTHRGWIRWPEVLDDDTFLTLHLDTDVIEWQKASRVIREAYSGDMIQYKTMHSDLLVTPEHRVLASRRTHTGWTPFGLVPAQKLRAAFRLRSGGGTWVGQPGNPDLCRLFGFFIGDGCVDKSSPAINFHLRKRRKIEYLQEVADRCGFRCTGTREHFRVRLPKDVWEHMKQCYSVEREKQIPNWLLSLDVSCLEGLWNGLMSSDGHTSLQDGKETYNSSSYVLMNQLQELLVKIGSHGTIRRMTTQDLTNTQLKITRHRGRLSSPRVGWTKEARSKEVTSVPYSGMVYCATVPNSTLYVRRNNKVCWSGNSPFEHVATPESWSNWLAGDVPGNFHGWAQYRHRIGLG